MSNKKSKMWWWAGGVVLLNLFTSEGQDFYISVGCGIAFVLMTAYLAWSKGRLLKQMESNLRVHLEGAMSLTPASVLYPAEAARFRAGDMEYIRKRIPVILSRMGEEDPIRIMWAQLQGLFALREKAKEL